MKNQYFGDVSDLFKWDLVLEILTKIPSLNHFTYIPMLTPNDHTRNGMKIRYEKRNPGIRRKELVEFLRSRVKEGRRDIIELKRFFRESKLTKELDITIYKENEFFSHEKREEYFAGIRKELLSNSLIEVDQDIGLEVKSMKGREEKYIKYQEVKLLFNRMDERSVLLIWQYIPRVKRKPYFLEISRRLERVTGSAPLYISDGRVVFFVLIKNKELRSLVKNVLQDYAKVYNLIHRRASRRG
jgi:hypothetical protein